MKLYSRLILLVATFWLSSAARADFKIDLNTGFNSYSDGANEFEFTDMTNHIYIGASVGSKDQLYIGQNITIYSNEFKTATTTDVSTLELGPRFTYYFSQDKTVFVTFAWNPYAKGTRTTLAGVSEDISGSSLLGGIGYELKLSRNFFLGASLMYHSLSVSKAEVNNASREVSESYTSMTPMITLGLRFR